jgi:purine-binding chemotaxis protein CheW
MNDLLLIVNMAGQRVAIPASDVESVVELEGLTPVPCSAAHVAGLSALRSRVLTVIDCLAALELGRTGESERTQAVVVTMDGHPYALIVDSVEDVVETTGEVRPLRTLLAAGWCRVGKGMADVQGDLLLLIDTQALIAGPAAQAA